MRLSLHHRFLFIAVPRTASANLRFALDPFSELAGNTAGDFCGEDGRFSYHVTAAQMRRYCQAQQLPWESLFKFGFVRNPYERLTSMYRLLLQFRNRAADPRFFEVAERVRGFGGFRAFVQDRSFLPAHQLGYLADADDSLIVDFVGRYENLEEDFSICCDRIGLGRLTIRPQLTDGSDFGAPPTVREDSYYDDDTRRFVAGYYAKDFEVFGYDPRPV